MSLLSFHKSARPCEASRGSSGRNHPEEAGGQGKVFACEELVPKAFGCDKLVPGLLLWSILFSSLWALAVHRNHRITE